MMMSILEANVATAFLLVCLLFMVVLYAWRDGDP